MDAICQKHNGMIGPAVCLHCEIEALRRRLQDGSPVVEGTIQHMAMEIAALKKERDELKKDAERYRWLRDTQGDKTVRIMDRRYCNLIIDATLAKLGADKTGEGS